MENADPHFLPPKGLIGVKSKKPTVAKETRFNLSTWAQKKMKKRRIKSICKGIVVPRRFEK